MDLRKYNMSPKQEETATAVFNYQPFIISDDVQTGVAYSWLYQDDGGRNARANDFVLSARNVSRDMWERFCDANARLRNMYDDWIRTIAAAYPGGTLIDSACNNGYFLVRSLEYGISSTTGYDRVDHSVSVNLLGEISGHKAEFIHKPYDPWTHAIEGCKRHDVAVASLIMCHISDPLYFLAFLGRIAAEAIFLFTGMGTDAGYRIYYSKPNRFYASDEFPVCFDNDVALSKDLLFDSLALMGFKNIDVLDYKDTWLPASWYNSGNQQAILARR